MLIILQKKTHTSWEIVQQLCKNCAVPLFLFRSGRPEEGHANGHSSGHHGHIGHDHGHNHWHNQHNNRHNGHTNVHNKGRNGHDKWA